MKRMPVIVATLAVMAIILCLAPPGWAQAGPPAALTHQGRLTDSGGTPLNGDVSMQFAMYDAPTDGTLLLTDTQTVGVSSGLYTAKIGTGVLTSGAEASILAVFGNHSAVWLEISVNGQTLLPRTQIVASGFSMNAASLGGRLDSEFIDISSTGQSKSGPLTVSGGISTGAFTLSTGAVAGYVLMADSSGAGTWQPVSVANAGGWSHSGTTAYLSSNGDVVNVGGGNVAPYLDGKLQLDGSLTFGPENSDGEWFLRFRDDSHFIHDDIGPVSARVNRMEFQEFGNKTTGSGAFRWQTGSPALPGGAITRMILYGDDTTGGGHLDIVTGDLQLGGVSRITGAGSLVNVSYAGSPIGVGFGGTGATSFTANGILVGDGTSGIVATSAPTSAGQVLKWNGSAWAPGTDDAGGSGGTVTSVGTGAGLAGGTITTSGTIDLRLNASGGLSKTLGSGSNELGIAAGGVANSMLSSSSVTVTAGTGLSGGGSVALGGSTTISLAAPVGLANGGSGANLSATGGAGQYVKQATAGGAFTVGTIPAGDLPAHAHSGADITSGTIGDARLSTNVSLLNATQTFSGANTFSASGTALSVTNTAAIGAVESGTIQKTAGTLSLAATGANVITAATNGSERLRIDGAGNVGIGSANPGQKLTVAGIVQSTSGGFKFPDGTTQTTAAGSSGITSLNGLTASSQTFANDTNVTLSSSGSTHTLGWSGALSVARGGTGSTTQNFVDLSNAQTVGGTKTFSATTVFSGAIGVGGVTSPASQIHASIDNAVSNAATTVLTLDHSYNGGNAAAGIGTRIDLRTEDGAGALVDGAWIISSLTNTSGTGGSTNTSALRFFTVKSGTMAERMRFDNSSNTILSLSGGNANSAFAGVVSGATQPAQGIFMGSDAAASSGVIGVRDDSHYFKIDASANRMTFQEYGDFRWQNGSGASPVGVMKLDSSGNLIIKGSLTQNGTPDVAENIPTPEEVEAGDVVAADPAHNERAVRSSRPYQTSVLGVISTDPGHLLNSKQMEQEDAAAGVGGVSTPRPPADRGETPLPHAPRWGRLEKPLTLCGRVPVKVTLEGGAIKPGDLLTSSSTPGHAMKAVEPWRGGIIGTALEEFGGAGPLSRPPNSPADESPLRVGKVLVLVHLDPAPASAEAVKGMQDEISALRERLVAVERALAGIRETAIAAPAAGGNR